MGLLEIVALSLSACSVGMLALLVARRWYLGSRERQRRKVEERLRHAALELLHSGTPPPADLDVTEKEALADLLGRYARTVTGATHGRIVDYFAHEGITGRELEVLAVGTRGWRRATAAFRLGDIGTPAVAGELIAALHDPDRAVRVAAARSLGRLRTPEAGVELVWAAAERRVPGALVRWALLRIGSAALPELTTLLRSPNQRERAAAIQLVGLLGGPSEAGEVEASLRDSSALVREQAARALGRVGAERHVPALLDALEDRIPSVRASAATSLGYLRDSRAVPALAGHAESDQFEVAREAARALTRIDPARASEQARATGSDHLREAVDLAAIR